MFMSICFNLFLHAINLHFINNRSIECSQFFTIIRHFNGGSLFGSHQYLEYLIYLVLYMIKINIIIFYYLCVNSMFDSYSNLPNNNINILPIKRMKKVAYVYNQTLTNFHFSKQHPMKPKRVKMTHSLIQSYGLGSYLNMFQSRQATGQQLASFHDSGYVNYLQKWVNPKKQDIVNQYSAINVVTEEQRKARDDPKLKAKYKINQSFDCPGFDGLYNFCQLAAGGSLDAADLIVTGLADMAINWGGGFHHARRIEASGFCYINDAVICILQLLKVYPRILYLDIDVHHGDGVEEAFYNANRVMTVSFHQFQEDFFPGTGALDSTGEGIGKYFAVNVPLKRGISDVIYLDIFKKVMERCMSSYRPDVVVIQCGTDSLSKDKLGHLNLSIKGHGEAIKHMMGYGTPIILLGGGGYTIENVSRCWTYETSIAIGTQIDNNLPESDPFYSIYQGQQYKLHFPVQQRKNQNSPEYLNDIIETISENLRESEIRPSIAFHNAPKNFLIEDKVDWQLIGDDEDSLADSMCDQCMHNQ